MGCNSHTLYITTCYSDNILSLKQKTKIHIHFKFCLCFELGATWNRRSVGFGAGKDNDDELECLWVD